MEYGNELYHYGVKGMKWGVRRTPAQLGHKTSSTKKKKTGVIAKTAKKISSDHKKKEKAKAKAKASIKKNNEIKKKNVSEMSDEELRKAVQRLQLEKQYRDLNPRTVSAGEKFAKSVMDQVVTPAATDAGKQLLREYMLKQGRKAMNNSKK